jgi:phage-related protein
MTYVSNQNEIPDDDLEKIRQRLINQINSMSQAELSIIQKSQRDFRDFVADIFKAVAATFGYVIGVVVGTLEEIYYGIKEGFEGGFNAGRRKRR